MEALFRLNGRRFPSRDGALFDVLAAAAAGALGLESKASFHKPSRIAAQIRSFAADARQVEENLGTPRADLFRDDLSSNERGFGLYQTVFDSDRANSSLRS